MAKIRFVFLLLVIFAFASRVFSQPPSSPSFSLDATSEGATAGSSVSIGEQVTFRLQFVLPESTTISLRAETALPTGLGYVSGSARVSYLANTLPSFNGDFAGIQNVGEPEFTFPAGRVTYDTGGSPSSLSFDFGSVINNDGDMGEEFLIIEYDAVVSDIPANVSGTGLSSIYNEIIDEGLPTEIISPSNSVDLSVVEPLLSVSKAFSPDTQVRGGTTTLTLTVQNLAADGATGPVHDLAITDILDDWLNVTDVTVSFNPAATTFASTYVDNSVLTAGFAPGVTDLLDLSISGLPVDGVATVTVTLQIDPNADPLLLSRTITNTVSVDGDSLATDITPDDQDRAYSDSAADDLNVVKPMLLVTKTDSIDPVAARESMSYTVTINNTGTPSFAATGVVLTDQLPLSFIVSSVLPSQGTCAPLSGSTLTCNLGTIASGASVSVVVTGGYPFATADGTIVNNIAYVDSTEGNNGNDGNDTPTDNDDERAEEPTTVLNSGGSVPGISLVESGGTTAVTEGGTTDTFSIVLTAQPLVDVIITLTPDAQLTIDSAALTFTPADWNTPQIITVTALDDPVAEGAHTGSVSFAVSSADPDFDQLSLGALPVAITDNDTPSIMITPLRLSMDENSAPQSYQITPVSVPSAPFTIQLGFDPAQLSVNGSATPVSLTFSTNAPQAVTVDVLENSDDNLARVALITHTIISSGAAEYPTSLALPSVEVSIADAPPPPPTPLCEAHNFDEGGVVRSSISDADGYAVNCRVLYQNGTSVTWLGGALYSEANLGIAGLLDLGVKQAIDIFSPGGLGYFNGGAVFCLRGEGTLIWLAANGQPRHPEIIGSYTVPEFPGFTCATLFEPGTLVLVSQPPR